MVRYEQPSCTSRLLLPIYRGLRRPFKPKFIRLLLAVIFWVVMFVWMLVCGNVAAFRFPKNQTALPDLLFSILPEQQLKPLPEILLYVLLTSVVGRIIFHSDGVAIARRFGIISGCIYFLRGLFMITTSFPSPQKQCQNYDPTWTFSGTCIDLTGQTVHLALAALCWCQYTKSKFIAIVAWLLALLGMTLMLVNRTHYTVEILFSLILSMFVWKFYHQALALPPERKSRLFCWFEKNVDYIDHQGMINSSSSPAPSKYSDLDDLGPSSPSSLKSSVPSRLMELTESLGAPGPSAYKELSCVIK